MRGPGEMKGKRDITEGAYDDQSPYLHKISW